ncbi:two-component regulator propeller domain-containing protein [Carboxylicivirga sp. RSCT41]|uniref:hybrid sensor histidine kinase/response regulator n=1 Tax=Carboxylicivirga agarovorans TaxID=3417570 RepID=UPI003D33CBC3
MLQYIKPLLLTTLLCISLKIDAQNKRFFDYNEGLSNSLINKVYQDQLGFIWVATEDGLNRFDGIHFKTFTQKSNQLKANYITTITESKDGTLWFGLINGLVKYSHSTDTFEEIKVYVNDKQVHPFVSGLTESSNGDIWVSTFGYGLVRIDKITGRARYSTKLNKQFCSIHIRALFQDSEGLLWLGSDSEGVDIYNPHSGEIKNYSYSSGSTIQLPFNDIATICEDNNGHIYLGSLKSGLCMINKADSSVIQIQPQKKGEAALPVKDLFLDSKNRLWIGTDGSGLKRLNTSTKQLEDYSPPSSSFDFSKSKIHSIIEDRMRNIWVGIFQKGLFLFPESQELFNNYGYKAFGENSIGSSSITAISGDKNIIWIGTDGDGLYRYNKEEKSVEHIPLKDQAVNKKGNSVFSFNNSDADYLWIGTYSNGLIRYHKKSGAAKHYRHNPDNPNSLPADIITSIKNGANNNYWLSTYGAGVIQFDPISEQFNKLPLPDSINNLIPKWVNDVYIDEQRNFWIGSFDGLWHINTKKQEITIYDIDSGHMPSNVVYCIRTDYWGNMWVGTYEGLVRIDTATKTFTTLDEHNGLASEVICAIEEDEFHQIWLSTHEGLSRYNPVNNVFTNYYASDGLQSNEFSRNAVYKTADNRILFGGINGITEIRKDYNSFSRNAPEVMLTNFSKFNQEIKLGDASGKHQILNKPIVLADTIHLVERDNVFSINFTSKQLANQSRISYEYKIEGFDNGWNQSLPSNRTATYTNLPHGTYIFKVRGIDKDKFSEPRELTIIIHPPWYKTVWAKTLWFILSVVLVYIVVQMYKEKFRRIEVEKLNEKKMQFFINISHEIRTPLSLIIDPLDKLLSLKVDAETKRLYSIMQQNSNRIFRLINQLLDIRKIDKGQMLVKYQKTNLYELINEVASSYQYMASSRNIEFNFETTNKDLEVWIDPLNFEKVVINLLSNAFKFTPQGGKIDVKMYLIDKESAANKWVEITVTDNGIGIKKADLERIFERFYQVESSETRNKTGTGIGLHLSRSLVELHKGYLYAENAYEGPGSKFVIQLPLGNKHLPVNDLVIDANRLPAPVSIQRGKPDFIEKKKIDKPANTNIRIMIVEDELEIRNYLIDELSAKYKVSAYENGQLALAEVMNDQPDIIISDIMMPVMDGITFCKRVKNNIETSHIPLILLTALSKEEDKAEGIETGADMYLVKPFNTSFLHKSISNLLENRRKVAAKLENTAEKYSVEPIEIKSHDELMLQKVMSIIKDNLSNTELNVEMLADGVGISRVHMHRKLKELTNQSARDLIKNIRMKQAAYILVNKKMNISEVAYAVGYSSLSHFSTSFKGYYGVSPKEYVEKQSCK